MRLEAIKFSLVHIRIWRTGEYNLYKVLSMWGLTNRVKLDFMWSDGHGGEISLIIHDLMGDAWQTRPLGFHHVCCFSWCGMKVLIEVSHHVLKKMLFQTMCKGSLEFPNNVRRFVRILTFKELCKATVGHLGPIPCLPMGFCIKVNLLYLMGFLLWCSEVGLLYCNNHDRSHYSRCLGWSFCLDIYWESLLIIAYFYYMKVTLSMVKLTIWYAIWIGWTIWMHGHSQSRHWAYYANP